MGETMMRTLATVFALVGLAASAPGLARPAPQRIEVRAVIVTTWEYEPGGKDVMGELKAWKDRWPLATSLPFPEGVHALRYDPKTHVLAFVTGAATARAAASTMALGLDPRFDFSHAYWLVAGIAGVDPKIASVGSAAWARWIVDGDLGQEIDIREAPAGWPTGHFPFARSAPYQLPAPPHQGFEANTAYPLNGALVHWAYTMSRDVKLADDAKLAALRRPYNGEAARPPFVLEGDGLMSSRFWYGALANDHARRWVDYWTGGKGVFAMSAEEDSGIMQGLTQLAAAGRVKLDRVLVLRSASDYTVGPPGVTPAQLAEEEARSQFPALAASLENLYLTAAPVVRYLTDHWATTRDQVPGT
jgi:purine nucleoside permease